MNLEEARKVVWKQNNNQSLGELLDKGFLLKTRLDWILENADDPEVKEAARVIMDSYKKTNPLPNDSQLSQTKQTLPVGMTLEKAKAMIWPIPPYRGKPMGELIKSKRLSLKDLGYAIENAWEKEVRDAAKTLLLFRLEQVIQEPEPEASLVQVISGGGSFSRKKQIIFSMIEGMVGGILLSGFLFSVYQWISVTTSTNQVRHSISEILSSPNGAFVLAILILEMAALLFIIAFVPNWIVARLDKKIDEYQFGELGEEKVTQTIIQVLDGTWSVYRNISLPGRNKGDFDIILVGPPGVWALEVKNYHGQYRNIGEKWEILKKKSWKTAFSSPSRQANNNALRLANFLKADHINTFVNAAVVWANEESPLFVENPTVVVWKFEDLADELKNIWHGEKLTSEERKKIDDKFLKLCNPDKDKTDKIKK